MPDAPELLIAAQLMPVFGPAESSEFGEAEWNDRVLDNASIRDAWHTWLTQ